MFTWRMCRFPFWPIRPFFGIEALWGVIAILGVIFTLIMLIDCLKRPTSKFHQPLTKEGEYDKLIWAAAILLSLGFLFCRGDCVFLCYKKSQAREQRVAGNSFEL